MTRIGIVSLAHVHARAYAERLAMHPGVELRVAEDDPALAAEIADLAVDVVSTEEFWNWAPEAVVIASETVRHREHVERAASVGAHVLCEKPIATTRADARALIAACESAGVGLMLAFPVGFSREAARLREAVSNGELGEPISALGTNTGKFPAARDWFADPERSGGGALVDHIVHVAELLDTALGARAVSVSATTTELLQPGRAAPGVETGALVTVRYDSGLVASIDGSWSEPDASPRWGGLTLEVVGTAASVHMDPFAHSVDGVLVDGVTRLDIGTDLDALMLDAFLAAVRGERPFAPDAATGLRTLEIVLAAQESARTGQPAQVGR